MSKTKLYTKKLLARHRARQAEEKRLEEAEPRLTLTRSQREQGREMERMLKGVDPARFEELA